MTAAALDQLLDALAERIAQRLQQLQPPTEEAETRSPWLSVKSAAAYLDWPAQRLYKLTARGELPHYKQDGRVLFRRDELDQWLAQHAQPARSGDWINAEERAISR